MKKKIKLAVIAAVVLAIIVTVFLVLGRGINPKISSEDLESRILYNKVTNLANERYEKEVGVTENKQEVLATEKSDVKKQLKFDLTVCELCEEKRILLSRYDAEQTAQAEFSALKENNDIYYNILKEVLKELDISEEEYFKALALEAYCKYNGYTLKTDFEHTGYDSDADEDFDEQYEEYVNDSMAFSLFG